MIELEGQMEYRQDMEERLRELLEPAFREVPAREANAAIARARREKAGGNPNDEDAPAMRSYEVVLTTWDAFVRDLLPKMVYHLESVRAPLPECRGVIVSAFAGDRLFFVEAREFIAGVCRMLGVTPGQLVRRHGTGESRAPARDSLRLAPPKGQN
jgi:hypothetical protein